MGVTLRYTHTQFLAAVKGKYGFMRSRKMRLASDTLLEYENAKIADDNVNAKEMAMIGAWYDWSLTKEFRSVNTKTNGVCKKLAVEMGAVPDIGREERTSAFVLAGVLRDEPTSRNPADVVVTDMTVPVYMDTVGAAGGVVLIDAFGGGNSTQAHGFERCYGGQDSTVMDNIKDVLSTARDLQMPIFDVTMNVETTWKELTDEFSTTVINIVKPKQPLFMGDETYVENTLQKIRDHNVDYLVVMGWDANQCVAAAIFGVEPYTEAYVPGLLDYGWDVVSARNLLGANEDNELESKWGWPYIGQA